MLRDFGAFFMTIDASQQDMAEAYNICRFLQQTYDVEGDVVEIGVYSGGSAKLLNKYKLPNKRLYLFDTFDGWKDCGEHDKGGAISNGGMFFRDYEYVKRIFEGHNVEVIRGYFPDNVPAGFGDKRFSYVHLDVDTYLSTLNSLKYFYGKVSQGGVFMLHDYISVDAPGVKKAVDEFISDKVEKVVCLVDSQAMIVKS
jgi:hypothetical protein